MIAPHHPPVPHAAGPHAVPLRLVHAHDHCAAIGRVIPRVLCAEVVERLAVLNTAVRALRDMGLRVMATSLHGDLPADGEPVIRIARDPLASVAPLLDAAGPRQYRSPPGGGRAVTASCAFMGCLVEWEEQ